MHTKIKVKRLGYLFPKICSIQNLHRAFMNAKRGKGWYREVKIISRRPYYYLAGLKWMLENHKFRTSEYSMFIRHEGRKDRQIYKLPFFPDRIVQWAILQIIEPQLLRNFTADTYSAIPERGIHAALRKLRHAIDTVPNELIYCCKIDCKKFYPSIDHELLKKAYRRKYKDSDLLMVIDEIIDSISTCPATEENIDFYRGQGVPIRIDTDEHGNTFIHGVGIPIGNYFSQYDANFFLSGFDHWMKEEMCVKHYYRYMDDVCVFASTKEELHQILKLMDGYLRKNLNIRIKANYQIFPSYIRGVDFIGYRFFRGYTLLRKTTADSLKTKMIGIKTKIDAGIEMTYSEYCSINSYKGWTKYCNSNRLIGCYIEDLQPYADAYYMAHIYPKTKKGKKAA